MMLKGMKDDSFLLILQDTCTDLTTSMIVFLPVDIVYVSCDGDSWWTEIEGEGVKHDV